MDFVRNNQDISQNLNILVFPIPSLLDCSAVNRVAQRCQVSEGYSEEQDSTKNAAPELLSLIVRTGHFLFLPRFLFSSLLFKGLPDAVC